MTVQADLTALAPADAAVLQGLQRVCGVEVLAGGAPPLHWPGAVLATVEQADGSSHSWATAETALAQPDAYWGRPGAQALVSAPTPGPELSPQAPQLPEVAARMPGGRTLEITNQLDTRRRDGKPLGSQRSGDMGCGFGQRFWALLGDGDIAWVLPEGQRVAAVSYEDRYLNTPISCALLVDVISALKARYEPLDGWDAPRVEVATMFIDRPPRGAGLGSTWTAEWPDSARRDAALREAFAYAGIEAQVLSAGKHDLLHGRRLLVSFTDGTRLSIVPDQGWAYWTLDRSSDARLPTSFSLDAKPAELGRMLAEFGADVRGHRLPTLVAVYRG